MPRRSCRIWQIFGAMMSASTRSIARPAPRSSSTGRSRKRLTLATHRSDAFRQAFPFNSIRAKLDWLPAERSIDPRNEQEKSMFSTKSQSADLERAEMHQQLADTTSDPLARKMHRAMAAEYRRRAASDNWDDRGDATAELVIEAVPYR